MVSGPSACAQRRIPSNGKILFEAENLCFGGTYGPDQEERLLDIYQQEFKKTQNQYSDLFDNHGRWESIWAIWNWLR